MKPKTTLRSFLAAIGGSILAISSASAADTDGTWTLNNNGDWSDAATGNWSGGIVADGIGYSAFLSNVISGHRNITLNGNRTIGNIYAQDTSHNYTIIGASTLTLDASSGQSILDVVSGRALTINTPVIVNDGIQKTGAGGLTIGGAVTLGSSQIWQVDSNTLYAGNVISDGGNTYGITKTGAGRLGFGGVNHTFSGSLIINGGEVEMRKNDNGTTDNGLGTGNIILNGGAATAYWSYTFSRAQGTGAGEVQITGGISGFGGNGSTGGAFNIGDVTWGSSTFNPTEFLLQTALANTNGKSTFQSNIDLNGDDPGATPVSGVVWRTIRSDQTGYNFDGYGQFTGAITNSGTTNAAGLIKTGIGQHILSGANDYDGGTQVNEGTLTVTGTGALPGFDTSGKVTVAGGAMLAVRTNGWTAGDIDTLRGAATWSATSSQLGFDTSGGSFAYASDITEALSVAKINGNTLTLSGNNTYTGATTIYSGTLVADSATALGNGGDITFKGGTLQYTANSAAADFGSRIANSTSAILLNTNSQNVTLSNLGSGNTGGLDKQGSGTLTLTGTNTFDGLLDVSTGTLVVDGGTTTANQLTMTGDSTTLSIINGGTLNATGGNFDISNGTSNTYISIVGGGSTSTLNIGTNRTFQNLGYNPPRDNKDMLIDGDGVAGSAVFVAQDVAWGRSTLNSDLIVTDGGLMNIRDLRIGSSYYGETGINNTVTLGGGTAVSVINSSQDVYVGHGDRAAASSNTLTVGANGDLNVTRHMYVGHVNNTANSDNPSTNNKLVVTGGGTASMNQLSLGFADADGRDAGANIVEVTSGGELSTTGTGFIGRADNPTSTSNANTLTVSGTDSSWNAGTQTVYVGYTNNASAQSNNNILTIGTGGAVTNVTNLSVGFGTGTETGNQLVVNGSLTVNTLTVSTGNSLSGSGTIGGAVTVNGTLAPGQSPGTLTFLNTLGLAGDTIMEIDGTAGAGVTGGHDFVNLTGTGAAGVLTYGGSLTLDLGAIFGAGSYSWDLFSFASQSGSFDSVSLAGLYSDTLVNDGFGVWGLTDGDNTWTFTQSTGDLNLVVIPEPCALLLGSIGLLLLFRRRR